MVALGFLVLKLAVSDISLGFLVLKLEVSKPVRCHGGGRWSPSPGDIGDALLLSRCLLKVGCDVSLGRSCLHM